MAYGQKRLNRDDVRRGTRNFILSFLILCGITFCTVFLFFKNAQIQTKDLKEKQLAYRDVLSKSTLADAKLDEIYLLLVDISDNNSMGNSLRGNSVNKQIIEVQQHIAQDSVKDLRHLNILINQIKPMNDFKTELQTKSDQYRNLTGILSNCTNKLNQYNGFIQQESKPDNTIYNR